VKGETTSNENRKSPSRRDADHLRPEYDFSRATRSKYAARYAAGTNVVLLAPDVAELFPDSDAVNEALRARAHIIRAQQRKARRKPRRGATAR
jgi:hypothetical protein